MMYDLKDEKQAQEYLTNLNIEYSYQCYREKSPEGCHRLADFHESVKHEYEKAAELYKVNCDENKYGHSCFKLGNYNVLGKGMQKNPAEGLAYLVKSCDLGFVKGCHSVGVIHASSHICPPKDMKAALDYFTRSCEKGHGDSCYHAGGIYIQGNYPIRKDMEKAFQFTAKACGLGHMHACSNLGQMYKKGDGVKQDIKLGEQLLQKAKEMHADQTKTERTITFGE